MSKNITITAVVTTYRREWFYIERALKSIENQTYPVDAIFLTDDNPVGNKYAIVNSEKIKSHEKVRYLTKGINQGVAATRNFAIQKCETTHIAFLDDDDEWLPDKIEKQIKILEKHPGAGLIFGVGIKFGNNDDEGSYTWSKSIFKEHPTYQDMLANDHVGSASHPLISMKALQTVGFFLEKNQPAEEDYELWIRISHEFDLYGTDDALYRKYMPPGVHVSGNSKKNFIGLRNIYRIHKSDYKKNDKARERIYYNIVRKGIPAKTPQVIPYLCGYLMLSAKEKVFNNAK